MRLAFLVERPTQFEAPFFRFAARDTRHELRVLFTGTGPDGPAGPAFDPELGRAVSWGIDLLGGYPYEVAPARGRLQWLSRRLRHETCDLLIANGYTRMEYLLATARARRSGVATALRLDSVVWPDGPTAGAPERRPRPRGKRLLYSVLLLRLYDLFLGVGSQTLEYLGACGVPAGRQGLFPYAVDVEGFRTRSRLSPEERAAVRARLGVSPQEQAVLTVAKLHPREAPRDLLRALPHLPAAVRLLIAGDGPLRVELERLAAELAPGRARFLGYVPYAELPALYAAADLFVHAASDERWGVSVAEALACGLPVVASTRVGAAYDLVTAGANGWQYPAGDAAELRHRIGQALALDRQAVAAASQEVLARWDYAASWRHLLDAAERVAGGSAR
ncbi:MAG TPA: glycosyltransferase [Thermoanaerobaculia bacterium]|nr:glycosyltransferase [Thermoanaerobaculia bacterium]